eukprot:TRINITY_DN5231_c0_g1_i1.p1 TRINITY_DN5231_c0_g1~~TRINITY_DN5231_c0_g1_i1.p1  ORF type:complete len:341 (+),score=44.53 TRINITY_DN5231_c0_g1_i1:214-1236(+)
MKEKCLGISTPSQVICLCDLPGAPWYPKCNGGMNNQDDLEKCSGVAPLLSASLVNDGKFFFLPGDIWQRKDLSEFLRSISVRSATEQHCKCCRALIAFEAEISEKILSNINQSIDAEKKRAKANSTMAELLTEEDNNRKRKNKRKRKTKRRSNPKSKPLTVKKPQTQSLCLTHCHHIENAGEPSSCLTVCSGQEISVPISSMHIHVCNHEEGEWIQVGKKAKKDKAKPPASYKLYKPRAKRKIAPRAVARPAGPSTVKTIPPQNHHDDTLETEPITDAKKQELEKAALLLCSTLDRLGPDDSEYYRTLLNPLLKAAQMRGMMTSNTSCPLGFSLFHFHSS